MVTDVAGQATLDVFLPTSVGGWSLYFQSIAIDGVGGKDFASSMGVRVEVP